MPDNDFVDLDEEYRRIIREHRLSDDHPVSALVASFLELLGRDRSALPKLRESLLAESRKDRDEISAKLDGLAHRIGYLQLQRIGVSSGTGRAMLVCFAALAFCGFLATSALCLIGYKLIAAKDMCIVTDIQSTSDGRRGGLCVWK